jgi:hypothetical protein
MRFCILAVLLLACGPQTIGRPFTVNPRDVVRLGVDNRTSVENSLGKPHRRFTDPEGREVFVYVWADGNGGGEKYLVAFNGQGVAYLVEAVR